MPMKRLQYGEEFLDWWYNKGGCFETLFGLDSITGQSAVSEQFKKAIGPWDAPASPYAYYFEPKFSAVVQAYVDRATEVFKLLPKTTFLAEGDSLKYYETDLESLKGVAATSKPFTDITAESAPTIATLEEFEPAYLVDPWITNFMSRTRSTWQVDPKLDPAWIKQYHTENLPNQIDKMLTRVVDVVADDGTAANANIESIDRICSCSAEASTTYVSVASDPDIYWRKSTVLIDRSADTDDTFGGGAGEGIDLPPTAAARTLSLDMIDDVIAASKKYSRNKRYIGITGPKTLNELQDLIEPKQRFLDTPMDYQLTLQGVSTRKGARTGFTVGAIITNGIEIPMFTCSHVANEDPANRSSVITDANIGNIYFLDLDAIEIRVAVPITYLETPPAAMLTGDAMEVRHMFIYAAQLVATNFRAHAAVKYLKAA